MGEKKILSIIIPSCNMEKYLPACLEKLVGVQGLDVIIVNDGSKDRTSEIAHTFADREPGTFRVIDKPNGHYGSCINAGLAVATGVFTKVLDADDSFDSVALAELLERLPGCDARGVDAVLTDYVIVRENWLPDYRVGCKLPQDVDFGIETLAAAARGASMHSVAYRTCVPREMGYRQTEGMPYTDNEWAVLPMRCVRKAVYYPLPLYRYLVGRPGQSVALEQRVKNVRNLEKILERMTEAACDVRGSAAYRAYARKFVEHNAGLVCDIGFFSFPMRSGTAKVKETLAWLESQIPDAIPALDERTLDWRLPIRYLRVWRHCGPFRGVWMLTMRATRFLLTAQRRLRGLDG